MKKAIRFREWLFSWQGQEDSNPRHPVLETGVLPTELYPYICDRIIIAHYFAFCKRVLKKTQKNKKLRIFVGKSVAFFAVECYNEKEYNCILEAL